MRADQLKEGDKIVMEVADAGPVLGAKDAWCISFKPPSWRRDFVQNAGGHICVNPEDEFDTPNDKDERRAVASRAPCSCSASSSKGD